MFETVWADEKNKKGLQELFPGLVRDRSTCIRLFKMRLSALVTQYVPAVGLDTIIAQTQGTHFGTVRVTRSGSGLKPDQARLHNPMTKQRNSST